MSSEVTLGKENGLLRFASACALPLPSSAARAFSLLFRVLSTAGRRFSQENGMAKAGDKTVVRQTTLWNLRRNLRNRNFHMPENAVTPFLGLLSSHLL